VKQLVLKKLQINRLLWTFFKYSWIYYEKSLFFTINYFKAD